jgi:hypothetical protein
MRTCAIIHPLHLELETAPYYFSAVIDMRFRMFDCFCRSIMKG